MERDRWGVGDRVLIRACDSAIALSISSHRLYTADADQPIILAIRPLESRLSQDSLIIKIVSLVNKYFFFGSGIFAKESRVESLTARLKETNFLSIYFSSGV